MNIQIRIHNFTDIHKQTSYLLLLGYGDISPKTDHGKLFYIGFSVVSIPLMMTLLVSCGDIMSIMNRKIFGLVQRCLFRKYKLVSFKPISRGRGQYFVLRPKFIPITSIWVKLHKNVFIYVLEIYFFLAFLNKTKIINTSRGLPKTSLQNSPSILRSISHKIKSAVTLSKTDIYRRNFTRKYILMIANHPK